ncbi:M14 family zinc carboxypeptidase [Woodsholea maritima]|uniref:M14 family zinc carboxypeptidase n=1 Tax=Woodsholea maritima TaxID=240237 RepID=UPI000366C1CF|nr:M14 family zinc carboxypeptidase [Woodsholea maritima]
MLRFIWACVGLIMVSAPVFAEPYTPKPLARLLNSDVSYDAAIPLPETVLGYSSGEIIFTPDMLYSYARAVDAASDRVSIEPLGQSHFGRPILRVTITSPANQARLEDLRLAHLNAGAADSALSEDLPLVVQLTHGVHGSESSGYDSAVPILYHLAAAQDEATRALLDTTIVHQIILINPDGANRFANWTNDHHASVAVSDPQHREHSAHWPWGRTNHYWFDLNRQWLPVTQPEAVALVNTTHDWSPHVSVDLHEMGTNSTFFFSPGPVEGLHPLLSQDGLALNLELNQGLIDLFDREQQLYVTEELFDDFYLGYGSSYPGLIGSIPYLFEQSSARGLIQESDFGVQRYDDKIGQQARAALALINSAHVKRQDLILHRREFARQTLQMAMADPNSGYVFTSTDPARLAAFIDLLNLHRIEVYHLARDIEAQGRTYKADTSYVIPLRQPGYRIIEGLFETRIITDKTEFYDVSGWTQPLAYDLDYAPLRGGRGARGERVLAGDLTQPAPAMAEYGYVMEWSSAFAPRALYRLLDRGVQARLIPDETTVNTADGELNVPRGAILIPLARQPINAETLHALMVRAAQEDGVRIHPLTSGHTSLGSDMGGFDVLSLTKPKVLLITGETISMSDAGELWFLLDKEMHIPLSMIDMEDLSGADLSNYTHILMPHGHYGSLGTDGAERLQRWTEAGGTLIATRAGAHFLMENGLTSAQAPQRDEQTPLHPVRRLPAYDDLATWDTETGISGALFAARMDITHPLAFGFEDQNIALHRAGTEAFALTDNPFAAVVRYSPDDPLLSGYASRENRSALAGRTAMFAERRGSGTVILFADDPYFRAYFKGSARLVTNSLFFQKSFRNPGRRLP